MKIKYIFATETTEIEVDEEWATILIDLDRKEYNNNRKERRRHFSLDGYMYETEDFAIDDAGLAELLGRNYNEDKLHAALEKLSSQQRDLVHKIYFKGYSVNECAEMFNVDHSAISHRISRIKKRLKKLLSDRHI